MRNISIASKNGYTLEKVKLAKQYLDEIGTNKRNFDFKRLVEMYNEILGTNDNASGCRCQSPKYYNGIANYFKYGKMTLIANSLATESDFEDNKEEKIPEIENAANRINLGEPNEVISEPSESVSEVVKEDVKEEEKKKAGRPKKVKE